MTENAGPDPEQDLPEPAPKPWTVTGCLIVIIIAQLVSFGVFAPRLGFYYDDWTFLELARRGGGLAGAMKMFAEAGYWSRPVEILQFPIFFWLGGLNPLVYHILVMLMDTIQAALFFLLLDRVLGSRKLALTAAVLALIIPNRSIIHVWFAASPQTLALILALGSMILFHKWLEERRAGLLLTSQALYLSSVLCYESGAFLPLLLAGAVAGRALAEGRTWTEAVPKPILRLWPYGVSLAGALVYQRVALSFFQQSNPKSLGLSLTHALKAFGAGFECVTNRVAHLCWKLLPGFLGDATVAVIALWLAAAGAGALVLAFQEELKPAPVRSALGAAILGFIGAYLPYAVSASYIPQIFGSMSRTNGAGALVGGLLFALLAACLSRRPFLQRAFLLFLVLAFTGANWHIARHYARLWTVQQGLLAEVALAVADLPPNATVLLEQLPRKGQPPAFADHFDFSSALRIKTNRQDLSGNVVSDRMTFEKKEVLVRTQSGDHAYPYRNLHLYREIASSLKPLVGPP